MRNGNLKLIAEGAFLSSSLVVLGNESNEITSHDNSTDLEKFIMLITCVTIGCGCLRLRFQQVFVAPVDLAIE